MPKLVFRSSIWVFLLGIGLLAFGGYGADAPLYHLITGQGVYYSSSRYSHYRYKAGTANTAIDAFEFVAIALVGVLVLVLFFAQTVTLDRDGVIVRGFGGRVKFRQPYSELKTLGLKVGRNANYYVLTGGGSRVALPTFLGNSPRLVTELKLRAPHLLDVGRIEPSSGSRP